MTQADKIRAIWEALYSLDGTAEEKLDKIKEILLTRTENKHDND